METFTLILAVAFALCVILGIGTIKLFRTLNRIDGDVSELIEAKKDLDLMYALYRDRRSCEALDSKNALIDGVSDKSKPLYAIIEKYYKDNPSRKAKEITK